MSGFGPTGQRRNAGDRAGTVKGWVREVFALDDSVAVLVAELRCHEEGCPPVETVIAILRPEGREEHRLHLGLDDLSPAHLWQLAAGDHGCCR